MMTDKMSRLTEAKENPHSWMKIAAFYIFLFLLIKGLFWLTVPGLLVYFGVWD